MEDLIRRFSLPLVAGGLLVVGLLLWGVDNPKEEGAPTPPMEVTEEPRRILWGAYVGHDLAAMDRFEDMVGRTTDVEMVFAHFGNDTEFPVSYAPRIRDRGKTMVLFWEAIDYTRGPADQKDFSLDAIIAGRHDQYFERFATGAKIYDGPVIIIPYSEMNGNWFPWSGTAPGNTPEKFIAAYRHTQKFFVDAPKVRFGWAPNARDIPHTDENRFEVYYPGDDVVDVVGLDGFNEGGEVEVSFASLFGPALERLRVYEKPIWIFSMATAEGPGKPDWITAALTEEIPRHDDIVGWIWFNENKERDWRVDSSPEARAAFRDAVSPQER